MPRKFPSVRRRKMSTRRRVPYAKHEVMTNPERNRFGHTHRFVAPTYKTKMLISFPCQLPTSTAAHGYFAISGNSMHTPFNSSLAYTIGTVNAQGFTPYNGEVYSTVQCAGYSSICSNTAPYSAYRVLGSTLKVDVTPTANSDQILVVLGTVIVNQNSPTTIWTAIDAPNSSDPVTYSVYYPHKTLVKTCKTSDLFGVPPDILRSSGYAALYNASPSNEWCWVINFNTLDNSTTSATMGWVFRVEYDVEFFNPATGDVPDTLRLAADLSSKNEAVVSELDKEILHLQGQDFVYVNERVLVPYHPKQGQALSADRDVVKLYLRTGDQIVQSSVEDWLSKPIREIDLLESKSFGILSIQAYPADESSAPF